MAPPLVWRFATTSASPSSSAFCGLRGADVIVLPAAFTMTTGKDHWEVLIRARAIENQVYMVSCGQFGPDSSGKWCYGRSLIADPWGIVLGTAPDRECVLSATLDLDYLQKVRRQVPSVENRQADLYRWPDVALVIDSHRLNPASSTSGRGSDVVQRVVILSEAKNLSRRSGPGAQLSTIPRPRPGLLARLGHARSRVAAGRRLFPARPRWTAATIRPMSPTSPEFVIVTVTIALSPTPRMSESTYVVQEGDTLSGIAEMFGVTWDAIIQANNLQSQDAIFVGQELHDPGRRSPEAE